MVEYLEEDDDWREYRLGAYMEEEMRRRELEDAIEEKGKGEEVKVEESQEKEKEWWEEESEEEEVDIEEGEDS